MQYMSLPADARHRIESELVGWLTTTTADGAPSPTPVWFVRHGETLVVFSDPAARKIANIRRQPHVTIHLNCDAEGRGIVVFAGVAEVDMLSPASEQVGYLEKYGELIARRGITVAQFDALSAARIVIRPSRVWQGPGKISDGFAGARVGDNG